MEVGGVEIRRISPEERERIPASAWWGTATLAIVLAVALIALGAGWWRYLVALAVGAAIAYWLLWSAQR
jgi:fatty acid desaturase